MYGIPLEISEQHNYLGVCLHHKMPWQPGIDFICNKANCLLGFLHRNLWHCPSKLRECTYKQLILPTLDYCSPIWDPHQHTDPQAWNDTTSASLVCFWTNLKTSTSISVSEMLHKLNSAFLQSKRKQARSIFLFKMLNKQISIPDQ